MDQASIGGFDALEERIEQENIGIEKLLITYRNLLLQLMGEGAFETIAEIDLNRIRCYLESPANTELMHQGIERTTIRNELWSFAEDKGEGNDNLYNLIRCVLLIWSDNDDWDCAQDPPIFYCYSFLKKIIPNIEPQFVEYFTHSIFSV